jgi:hypothetical protein
MIMRIRTIKPSFFKDEEIAELPMEGRLLFQGLWLMADSEGRLEDRPKRIKVEIFPYDAVDIDGNLDLLFKYGFIIRYTVDEKRYIQVRNFLKHQRLSGKEMAIKSEYPSIPQDGEAPGTHPVRTRYTPGTHPVRTGEASGCVPESQEGKGKERKGKERACAREENSEPPKPEETDPPPEPCALTSHSFEKFKALMPLRNGKFLGEDECRAYWARQPALWNQWIGAVENYRGSREVSEGAVCSPLRFLRQKWCDWCEKETQPLGHSPPESRRDLSWKTERERDEKTLAEFARKVVAGEVTVRPRDRLPFESQEDYNRKIQEGKIPMISVNHAIATDGPVQN